MVKKYNIVCVQADYKTIIVGTFLNHRDALEALSVCIGKEFKNKEVQNDYRVYYESNSEISIHQVGLLYGKTLYCKYFILEFDDKTDFITLK